MVSFQKIQNQSTNWAQNRGIGKAICQLILSRRDASQVNLLATSRQGRDLELDSNVSYPKLEIDDSQSIKALADDVAKQASKVDILINNAGTYLDASYSPENAKKTLDVNYRGTLKVCVFLKPLTSRMLLVCRLQNSIVQRSEPRRITCLREK
jgi:carbonyl reductase 1